jgi:hypothetical protein
MEFGSIISLPEDKIMNFSQIQYARLDREKIARLRELETKFGSWLVAVEPIAELAELTDEELQELKSLEKEMGVTLLAYKENNA